MLRDNLIKKNISLIQTIIFVAQKLLKYNNF